MLSSAEQMLLGCAHISGMPHVPPHPLLFCREGFYMQQDADECWGNILTSLRDKLKASLRTSSCLASGSTADRERSLQPV